MKSSTYLCLVLAFLPQGFLGAQALRDSSTSASQRRFQLELFLGSYLLRRWEVTRQQPVVRLCGPEAVALMTPAFTARLTRKEYRLADSIEVIATCPPRDSTPPWGWSPDFVPGVDLVMILQLMSGPLSSSLDATVGLTSSSGDGRHAGSRRERFEWDYPRDGVREVLRFSDFNPPLSAQYQLPPLPPGLTDAPEAVLGQFLRRRWEITGQRPVVQLCDPGAVALMTPTLVTQFTRGEGDRFADSIVVEPTCEGARSGPWLRSLKPALDADLVIVTAMSITALRSSLEIVAWPRPGGPPYPRGRRERFEWEHLPGGHGEVVLTFTDFDPVE